MGGQQSQVQKKVEKSNKIGVVSLANERLTELPKNLELNTLRAMDLSHNNFKTLDRTRLSSKALKKLILDANSLAGLEDGVFQNLPALTHLSIQMNNLITNSFHLSCFAGLSHLKKLNLSHNHLTTLPAAILALSSLDHLDVSHNELQNLFKETDLSKENSGNNNSDPTQKQQYLSKLISLDASHNKLTVVSEQLVRFQALRTVNFHHNQIKFVSKGVFIDSQIDSISLAHNPILESGEEALTHLEGYDIYFERKMKKAEKKYV